MSAEYWIWLQKVLGYSSDTLCRVITEYETAEKFYSADDREKTTRCRLSKSQIERLHKVPKRDIFGILDECERTGISIITPEDAGYPEKLINIPNPPAVLYVKGKMPDFDRTPTVTIVGPRKISTYGEKYAYVIAGSLASCGFIVVSGGAVGGDSASHKGALDSGGITAAVLGCGINSEYLKSNYELRNCISKHGCLISEYSPSEKASKYSFPQRNRIMAGLANGVAVVEGGQNSGTMITARLALEQGRDVFAIPGRPSDPACEGTNRLIADGAKPLLSINDIVSEYLFLYPDRIKEYAGAKDLYGVTDSTKKLLKTESENKEKSSAFATQRGYDISALSGNAKKLISFVNERKEPFTLDEISDISGLDVSSVIASITELEIFGIAKAIPGGRYMVI